MEQLSRRLELDDPTRRYPDLLSIVAKGVAASPGKPTTNGGSDRDMDSLDSATLWKLYKMVASAPSNDRGASS